MSVKEILVGSGYGANTQEPYVEIEVPKRRLQMSPENARDLALSLLQAAEAAYTDSFLIEFMTDGIGLEMAEAAGLLVEYRKWRDTKQEW